MKKALFKNEIRKVVALSRKKPFIIPVAIKCELNMPLNLAYKQDPKHISKKAKNWFTRSNVNILD